MKYTVLLVGVRMNENKVILYTTHCPMCKMLRLKLDKANIKYEICDDVDLMISKGYKKAPMLEVDGNVMSLKEALTWLEENK